MPHGDWCSAVHSRAACVCGDVVRRATDLRGACESTVRCGGVIVAVRARPGLALGFSFLVCKNIKVRATPVFSGRSFTPNISL